MKPPPPNALVNKIVALTLVLLLFSGTLGLSAVWMRQEIFATANRNRVVESQLADVGRKLDEVRAQVATAESVGSLLEQNGAMRLALAAPRELQVARIARDPLIELGRKRAAEAIFANADAAANSGQFAFTVVPASYRR
jgi:hypothetical protein